MSEKQLTYTITDVTSEKENQVFMNRSLLEHSKEVRGIEAKLKLEPDNSQLWMNKGLGLAKQKLYREAVEAFSTGLYLDPFNALLYRHRGHRLISSYRFYEAAADFEMASRLDQNNWNIWYHLGFAYYLIGEHERAEKVYRACLDMTASNSEHLPAIVNWRVINLMEMGDFDQAMELTNLVTADMESGENFVYQEMVLVYKGEKTAEEVLTIKKDYKFADMEYATKAYGISRFLALTGKQSEAEEIINKILNLNGECWAAFGYIAAHSLQHR